MTDYAHFDSPIGRLLIAGRDGRLSRIDLPRGGLDGAPVEPESGWRHAPETLRGALDQLGQYFRGERRQFELELTPAGSDFQQRVWRALLEIPWGSTLSYGDLAQRIGRPSASRAVGAANGRNPLPIVVPCHRVIGADGSLTGYGGGLDIKRWLLEHEGVLERQPVQASMLG